MRGAAGPRPLPSGLDHTDGQKAQPLSNTACMDVVEPDRVTGKPTSSTRAIELEEGGHTFGWSHHTRPVGLFNSSSSSQHAECRLWAMHKAIVIEDCALPTQGLTITAGSAANTLEDRSVQGHHTVLHTTAILAG